MSISPFYCPGPNIATYGRLHIPAQEQWIPSETMRDYYAALEEEENRVVSDIESALHRRLALRERFLDHQSIYSSSARTCGMTAKVGEDFVFESIHLTSPVLMNLSDMCLPIRAAFALTTTATDREDILVKDRILKPLPYKSPLYIIGTVSLIKSPPPSQIVSHLAFALQKGSNSVVGWGSLLEGVLY